MLVQPRQRGAGGAQGTKPGQELQPARPVHFVSSWLSILVSADNPEVETLRNSGRNMYHPRAELKKESPLCHY